MQLKPLLAVSVAAGFFTAAAEPAAPELTAPAAWRHELDIRAVDNGQWGCPPDNAAAVLRSAAGELWRFFPEQRWPRFEVVPQGGPIFYYDIGSDRHVQVRLATGRFHWAQMAYQFAHEFCHVLCHPQRGPCPCPWFQETLCECRRRRENSFLRRFEKGTFRSRSGRIGPSTRIKE